MLKKLKLRWCICQVIASNHQFFCWSETPAFRPEGARALALARAFYRAVGRGFKPLPNLGHAKHAALLLHASNLSQTTIRRIVFNGMGRHKKEGNLPPLFFMPIFEGLSKNIAANRAINIDGIFITDSTRSHHSIANQGGLIKVIVSQSNTDKNIIL